MEFVKEIRDFHYLFFTLTLQPLGSWNAKTRPRKVQIVGPSLSPITFYRYIFRRFGHQIGEVYEICYKMSTKSHSESFLMAQSLLKGSRKFCNLLRIFEFFKTTQRILRVKCQINYRLSR